MAIVSGVESGVCAAKLLDPDNLADHVFSMASPIRVAIFDDHELMRETLVRALTAEGSFEVVASGGTAGDAAACGYDVLPDLMLCDLQMPGYGLDAVRQLYLTAPRVAVVVLSSDDSEHLVSAAYSAGAFGFFTKGQPLRQLIADLKDIAHGRSLFSPALARRIVSPQYLATPWSDDGEPWLAISPREEQILSRYGQGFSIEEIAGSTGLSTSTVGAFLTNILHKLHEQTLLDDLTARPVEV